MAQSRTVERGGPSTGLLAVLSLTLGLVVLAVVLLVSGAVRVAPAGAPAAASGGLEASRAPAVGTSGTAAPPLRLTDQDGRPFDLADLAGTPAIVFFGYTHCPDVCPATIGTLNAVLMADPGPVRVVFVTVDPERDTVAALRDYADYLLPAWITLTGSPAEIRATAAAWHVTYARVETGSAGGYSMAHTADAFLVGSDGRLVASFPFGTPADTIVGAITDLAS